MHNKPKARLALETLSSDITVSFYIKNTPIHPYDTRARYGNCDLRVFSDALTLSDLCQPSEMFFNCFMKLNRSLGSPPFSGTLKFFVDFQGSGASTNTL